MAYLWTQDSPATTPDKITGLRVACLVYDSDRDRMVLWGYQPSRLETWEYYSGNWHKVTTAHAPTLAGTTTFGACYDPIRQEVVLIVNKGTLETWTYNGSDWTQKSPAASPTGTITQNLVWDSVNNCAIMVGGAAGPSMKTWKWDGTTWTQLTIAGTPPSFRSDFGFGFYPPDGVFILFGGSSVLNDTWELDISALTWTHVFPATTPAASTAPFIDWDPSIGFGVMLDANTDTWLWDGTDWTDATPSPDLSPARSWMMIAYDSEVGDLMGYGGNNNTSGLPMYETWFFSSDATVPDAPVLTGECDEDDAVLNWTTPSDGGSAITGYDIYRGSSTGTETLYDSVGVVNTYTDTDPGGAFFYKVLAVNAVGDGPLSNETRVGCPIVTVYQRMYGWRASIDDNALETVEVFTSPQGFTS